MESCNDKIIVAIDGFSSSGKSTFAREIASRLGYVFIDTGAMYRAVTLYALESGAFRDGILDRRRLVSSLDNMDITFRFNPSRKASDIYLNGEPAEEKIRTIEVSNRVSEVSAIPEVRSKLVSMQQAMGRERGIVMDGRDIGTVVFPDAEIKIFLTSDPAVRASRRCAELAARGTPVPLEEIEKNIRERDIADQSREVSPLRRADDALLLDNTHMSPRQQMEWFDGVLENLRRRKGCGKTQAEDSL